jgi:hypothetical protein
LIQAFYGMVSGWYVLLWPTVCGWHKHFVTDVFSTQQTASAGCSLVNEVCKFLDKQSAAVILYGHVRPLQKLAWAWPYGMVPIITRPHIHRFPVFVGLCRSVSVCVGPTNQPGCGREATASRYENLFSIKQQTTYKGWFFMLAVELGDNNPSPINQQVSIC